MLTDYHSHLLPAMDDGAKDIQTSIQLLDMYKAQGVGRVIATPHYYSHKEPVESFIARRAGALEQLAASSGEIIIMQGAEVFIEKGISEAASLEKLTLGDSRCILLELPWHPLKDWVAGEIFNVMYGSGLTVILAHIERYLQWYKKEEMLQILSIPEIVLQLNNEALFKRQTLKFALKLIRGGFPVIFGSDAHNTGERPPNVEAACKILRAKLKQSEMLSLTELNESLI